jgi:hypothetical protein
MPCLIQFDLSSITLCSLLSLPIRHMLKTSLDYRLVKERAMLPKKIAQPRSSYNTWYGFKNDLESLARSFLPVEWWLRAKPKTPLPWSNLDMQDSLVEVGKIKEEPLWNRGTCNI